MTVSEAIAIVDAAREEYAAYRVSCIEDGHQPECFADWARDPRAEAEARYRQMELDDTLDLY